MSPEERIKQIESYRSEVSKSAAYGKLAELFDEGTMVELDPYAISGDGPAEVITAYGSIAGIQTYAFAQNTEAAAGAFSRAQAAKIKKLYSFAIKTGAPVVGIYDSNGALLKQGGEILEAYGDMLKWVNNLSGVVPQISVITGACIGTSALIASCADVVIACKDADFGIDTAGNNPTIAQSAECGNVSIVAETASDAVLTAKKLIEMLPQNNLSVANLCDFADNANGEAMLSGAAANIGKSDVAYDIINAVADADSFVEILKDAGVAAVTGLATVAGSTVGFVATRSEIGNGKLDEASTAKAARFVRFCDAFSIPVVSFVDTFGFASVKESAMLAHAYAEATTVKVSIITGAAYGAAFVAMAGRGANSDMSVAWNNAVIAPLAPETITAILYNDRLAQSGDPLTDRQKLVDEYKATLASPFEAAAQGFIEDVINPADTRKVVISALDMLSGKRERTIAKKHSNIRL